MRSNQESAGVVEKLEQLLRGIREEELPLDELVGRVNEGIVLYRQFRKAFADERFDVVLASGESFDWKALG